MRSIKLKLVLAFIIVVFLAMMISSTFIVIKYKSDQATQEKSILISFARKIEEQIIYTYEEEEFKNGFNSMFSNTFYGSNIQGAILSGDGFEVLATTNYIANVDVPVVISAVNGQESYRAWREDIDSSEIVKKWFEYAKPVLDSEGNVEYIIYTRLDASDSVEALNSMIQTLAVALFIALSLTAIMSMLLSKTVTDPIIELKNKAELLAKGDLDQKAVIENDDEIGELSKSFNYMAKELKRVLITISYEKNKVEVVLNNMQDGVIAFDHHKTLLHANSSAFEILSTIYINFEDVVELFKENSIEFDNNILDKEHIIVYADKYLKVNVSEFGSDTDENTGVIIVIQDVTKSQKLDKIRKDFVANVSHEIRTPLTTIKTYSETLRSGAMNDESVAENFLKIIESEADRMTSLADDLLELSKLDNNKLKLVFEKTDLCTILERCIMQTEVLAINNGQNVYMEECSIKEAFIFGDVVRLNQVFNNIVTNAIKYNKPNGEVRIYVEEFEHCYDVVIEDTGIGIDKKDLDRIFERFYRVDKARSRAMGGTGLGLSIANQIVKAHKGTINAYSTLGVGTKMVVTLNKYFFANNINQAEISLIDE